MSNHRTSRRSRGRRGAGLLLGAAFTTLAVAQEPQGLVAGKVDNLGDLIAPKSAGFTQQFGVKDVQGQLRLYGRVGVETAGSDAKDVFKKDACQRDEPDMGAKVAALGGLAADVDFFGAMREVAALEIKAEAPIALRAHAEIKKVVRVCGFTIELADEGRSRSNAIGSKAEAQKVGPKELLPGGFMTTVMVGPVPLLIRANAGVGVELGAAPFVESAAVAGASSTRLGVDGTAGAYLNGWVVGGVGGGCRFASACAGVKADVRLIENTVGLRLGYGTQEGLLAQLRYKFSPAVLSVSAIAYVELKAGWLKIGRTFEQLLFQWSAPALEATIGT